LVVEPRCKKTLTLSGRCQSVSIWSKSGRMLNSIRDQHLLQYEICMSKLEDQENIKCIQVLLLIFQQTNQLDLLCSMVLTHYFGTNPKTTVSSRLWCAALELVHAQKPRGFQLGYHLAIKHGWENHPGPWSGRMTNLRGRLCCFVTDRLHKNCVVSSEKWPKSAVACA
jgi:hypothetical protein